MLPAASLPDDAFVLLVDSARTLSEAEAFLQRARDESSILAVAIDAEWGPTEEEEGGGQASSSRSSSSDDDVDERGRARSSNCTRRQTSLPAFTSGAEAATLLQVAVRTLGPLSLPGTKKATTTLVFLFDLLRCDHGALAPTLRSLLSPGADGEEKRGKHHPLKLGWGLRGDLAALHAAGEKRHLLEKKKKNDGDDGDDDDESSSAAAPPLSAAARVARPAVDLRGVVLSILQREKATFAGSSHVAQTRHGFGLAAAVAAFLGRRLDKEHQCSAWGKRPLSGAQLRYAALDAAVLLELAEAAAERAWRFGVAVDDDDNDDCDELASLYSFLSRNWSRVVAFDGSLCGVRGGRSRRSNKSKNNNNRKGREKAEEELFQKLMMSSSSSSTSSIRLVPPWGESPENAKFLVDNNEGLARQLRLWGVDAQSAPSPTSASPCSVSGGGGGGGGGRVARSAERAASLVAAAVGERRVLLTSSRALFSLSLSSSSSSAAAACRLASSSSSSTTTAVSFVHLLCSSPSTSPPAAQKKKSCKSSSGSVPRARDLAADVLRRFDIRPSSSAGSSTSPSAALLSRCSACNGDFLPRPFDRGDLPEIAIEALGRSTACGAAPSSSSSESSSSSKSSPSSSLPVPEDKELWVCSRCGKVYWHGAMYARAVERLTKRLERGLLD